MTSDALERIASEADHIDTPPPGDAAPAAPGAPEVPPQSPNYQAIAFLIAGFRELASVMLKVDSLRRTLHDGNAEQCARVLAPVADKYGIDLGGMLSGPEAAAIMVAGPILWGAWRELDAELRARKAKKVEPDDAGQPASKDDVSTQPANAG